LGKKKKKDNVLVAYFNRASKRTSNLINYYTEPSAELLLPPPLPAPYQRPYTLIIELDETLVHSTWNVRKRRGSERKRKKRKKKERKNFFLFKF
jgi:hypothetical protein